ncbi:DUF6786 family protein [Confluentibacter flavum]|uniref:Uncharacterized protein n=1 Tax=Confluentibacter flavum TaxID=1909700 RepID=A0A2N3HHU7_9FLAO|nr:DUF6786 family protein [Confluentibacter flavum]PKQ44473.1 hypothetical protein CSW08_13620 [Confluentibacter flavum]
MRINKHIILVVITTLISCVQQVKNEQKMDELIYKEGSLGYDLKFLQKRDKELVVLKIDSSQVVISPKFQGKVFTSTASGLNGKSFGWINYKAFDEKDDHMNAYGGENRFWLGPEGSAFSLFFKPGDKMNFDNWKTPPPIDSEYWKVTDINEISVTMEKEMSLRNYADTQLDIKAVRRVEILGASQIENLLHIDLGSLNFVGFKTYNEIINTGQFAWTKETGAPCIWILDMFPPSDNTVILIPFHKGDLDKFVTTDYFGEISLDRIKYLDSTIFFRADGKSRGKLGISPKIAKNVAGSYDAINNILTIAIFDVEKESVFLNQEWTTKKNPFVGDVINAYNDGPLEDGSQMGPFYEIESASPAAFLSPEESLIHNHSVFHFTGDDEELNKIIQSVFGVSMQTIKDAFQSGKIK